MQVVAFYEKYPMQVAEAANFPVSINLLLGSELGALTKINSRPEFNLPPSEPRYYVEFG